MIDKRPQTKDIYLAAVFMALGAQYDGSDKSNPRQIVFYFKPEVGDEEDAQPFPFSDAERNWVNGTQLVNAKLFANALKDLKSVVHSG